MPTLDAVVAELVKHAPDVALFFVVLVVGWIASAVLRRVVTWSVRKSGLEAIAEKAGVARLFYAVGIRKGFAAVAGRVVGLAVLLLTFAAAAEVAGLDGVTRTIGVVVGYLPRLAVAGGVLLLGITFGQVLERIVRNYGVARGDVEAPEVLGRVAYYGVVTVAAVLGAAQAGIETALVERLVVLAVGLVMGAGAVSFALASRQAMGNVIAARYLARIAPIGAKIRIDGREGVVVRYAGACVLLRTGPGALVSIPCSRLFDGPVDVAEGHGERRRDAEAGRSDVP